MGLFREEVSEYRKTRLHGDVVLSQPISTRVMVLALFGIIAIAATWVSLGTYARIETVPGILVTDVPSAKVVATQAGIVTELHASEGKLVQAGDRLAVINLDRTAASGETVASRSLSALAARRELAELQVGLSAQRASAESARLAATIAAAEQQVASLREQIELQKQVVLSNQNMFDQIATVVDRGFVSKVEFERRRQSLISSQQQLATLRQQEAARLADSVQARAQMRSLSVESAQTVSDIQSGLQGVAQQQAQLEGEQGYIVSAPIAGRITVLQTAKGRTASPNVPLMVIVPENSGLRAELYAPTRAIGFVKSGQETRILFDAFPYQRFGSFGGKVQSVSRIVVDPRETEVPIKLEETVYRVTVALDKQAVSAYGENVPLQPGMTLKANIVLERQSFLAWLLQPLNAVLKRTA
ncbi:MAG: HlyD family efflux transporter periplasmic adaptor subunit [Sphingopyxis sp.]|nr:HlyD family efflux transporter periplasmic adaptor subunit [Sphingopyxis sp.]